MSALTPPPIHTTWFPWQQWAGQSSSPLSGQDTFFSSFPQFPPFPESPLPLPYYISCLFPGGLGLRAPSCWAAWQGPGPVHSFHWGHRGPGRGTYHVHKAVQGVDLGAETGIQDGPSQGSLADLSALGSRVSLSDVGRQLQPPPHGFLPHHAQPESIENPGLISLCHSLPSTEKEHFSPSRDKVSSLR